MIGCTSVILNHESVREALQEYLNKQFTIAHAVQVSAWSVEEDHSSNTFLRVDFEPASEPTIPVTDISFGAKPVKP